MFVKDKTKLYLPPLTQLVLFLIKARYNSLVLLVTRSFLVTNKQQYVNDVIIVFLHNTRVYTHARTYTRTHTRTC